MERKLNNFFIFNLSLQGAYVHRGISVPTVTSIWLPKTTEVTMKNFMSDASGRFSA